MTNGTISGDELTQLRMKVAQLEKQLLDAEKGRADDLAKQKKDALTIQEVSAALQAQATAQLNLLKAQVDLNVASETQDAQVKKRVTDALREQLEATSNLAEEKAKAPFSDLLGIKEATKEMQLPAGKQGTITVAAGTAGTALLRSNEPLLKLLNAVAEELAEQHPDGAVVVNEAQLDQAYQARFVSEQIEVQTSRLAAQTANLEPVTEKRLTRGVVPATVAAAYTGGMLLDVISSFGKLFRVDRKMDVFSRNPDAGQILGYLLEAQDKNFNAKPEVMREEALKQAEGLVSKLAALLSAIQGASDKLAQLNEVQDEEKTNPSQTPRMADGGKITLLKAELANAKSLLESLDPSKKQDDFWTQVKGLLIGVAIKGRDRLLIEVEGQAIQITESRWYRSDRLTTSGEIQVAYRLFDKEGNLRKAAVILKASPVKRRALVGTLRASFQSN